MKIILIVISTLGAVFYGGCAFVAWKESAQIIAILNLSFSLLNVLIIGYLMNWKIGWESALFLVGSFELLLVLFFALLPPLDGEILIQTFWLPSSLLALKGVLTVRYAIRLDSKDDPMAVRPWGKISDD